MTKEIIIKDIVSNTTLNDEGVILFKVISDLLNEGNNVILSLNELEPMSSSFMNSSFGAIIDNFGIDTFKEKIRISDYKPSHAIRIKNYIDRYNEIHR